MTTHYAPLTSIVIRPNRQRTEFDMAHINQLRESFEAVGLLHAPVVRVEGEELVLVAGECRLKAIADLHELGGTLRYAGQPVPEGLVPYVTLGELTPIEAMEAELEENIRRKDLTWQERSRATADLMNLRSRLALARGEPPPTVAEIMREVRPNAAVSATGLGQGFDDTRKELILAKHLGDAGIAKAKTMDDAWKLLKQSETKRQNEAIAARLGVRVISASHTVVQADTRAWLASCPEGTFDVILSDPPYGMGADTFGDSGQVTAGAHEYTDDYESWVDLMTDIAPHLWRVAKPDAHMYLFCDFDRFHELKSICEQLGGWRVHRTPLVWFKRAGFRQPWPDQGPQRKYELILYAVKGNKPITQILGDVLEHPADEALGWAAQKPVALFEDLLRRSCIPGEKVLDPFCGSGPIFPAAQNLRLFATGIEQHQTAYGIAAGRVERLKELA